MEENSNTLNKMLKQSHTAIGPKDSWDELRTRIDQKLNTHNSSKTKFWRTAALSMAACLIFTLFILSYVVMSVHGFRTDLNVIAYNNEHLIDKPDLDRLGIVFSQVTQLFGEKSQWVMVGPVGTDMGTDNDARRKGNEKIVVIRLAISGDTSQSRPQYFDLVVRANEQANVQLPLANAQIVDLIIKPTISNGGEIEAEIVAKANSTSEVKCVITMNDKRFTSLIRMRTHSGWLNIDGTGQKVNKLDGEQS